MIVHNAIGLQSDILSLLEKSILHMDKNQIRAWMKYEFDPSSMFCMIIDNKVVSCLQTKRRTFYNGESKCMATVFTMAATLPDYRQRRYFSALLEAALSRSNANDLVSVVYTTFPKLFETRSFLPVSRTLKYSISSYRCDKGNEKNVSFYNETMDLYPIYKQFMSCFDGSIQYTKQEFENQLAYQLNSQKKILVMKKDNDIDGFLVYKDLKTHIKVDYMVYLNSSSIYDAFRYLSLRTTSITFIVSEYERMEKLFLLDYPRLEGELLVRLNHARLFSQWSGKEIKNASQYYQSLENPVWMHVIE